MTYKFLDLQHKSIKNFYQVKKNQSFEKFDYKDQFDFIKLNPEILQWGVPDNQENISQEVDEDDEDEDEYESIENWEAEEQQ